MERNLRRTLSGIVVSDKMDKTRVVEIQTFKKHPLYGKRIKYNKKYKMHDEKNASKLGDTVKMRETRRISKDKYFMLIEIKNTVSRTAIKPIAKPVNKKVEAKPIAKLATKKVEAKPIAKPATKKVESKPIAKKVTKPAAKKVESKPIAKPIDKTTKETTKAKTTK